ncbi:MAG TPA: hypothetical protein VD908_12970 [Cytophagales bacterium]|nr:hypothetical protein [Cytophagales bacterium]
MKRNSARILLLALILFVSYLKGFSQTDKPPRIIPQSPNTASLGKYGDYKVSLFTGLPEISIPIYEVKSGDLTVPITLSYHASGIKISDRGSWVGLGWSLNYGGMVSRRVNGKADEKEMGYYYVLPYKLSGLSPCDDYGYIEQVALGKIDLEPDIFSFSINNKSGKFYLNRDNHSATQIPLSSVRIDYETSINKLNSFEIFDEDGTLYRFGKDRNGVSYGETSDSYRTSWMLTEIESANTTDRISFNYQTTGWFSSDNLTHSATVIDLTYNGYACTASDPFECNSKHQPKEGNVIYESNPGGNTEELSPSEIYFENGKIEFLTKDRMDYTGGGQALDKIKVYGLENGTYKVIKTIKFSHSYFQDYNHQENLRLKLDQIFFLDEDGVIQENYKFDYETDYFSWDIYTSNPYQRDHWGYYNGKQNSSLIPRMSLFYQPNLNDSGGDNIFVGTNLADGKEPDSILMKQGILKKIEYPTGGYTEFDFEINRYKEPNGGTFLAGGLRVKEIRSYKDSHSKPLIKTYKYGYKESGYGQRNFLSLEPQYYYNEVLYKEIHFNWTGADEGRAGGGQERRRTVYSNPLVDVNAWDASTVVYPVVTEYFGNSVDNIGKIIYTFDKGKPLQDQLRIPNQKESYHWQRGHLTEKRIYDNNGKLFFKLENSYNLLNYSNQMVGAKAKRVLICNCDASPTPCPQDNMLGSNDYVFGSFSIFTGAYKLIESREYSYQPGDTTKFVSTYKKYKYSLGWQIKEITESSSLSGEEIVTRMKHPLDYGDPTALTGILKHLVNRNALGKIIEKYVFKQNTDSTKRNIISGIFTVFKNYPENTSKFVADTIFQLESNSIPFSSFTPSYLDAGIIKKDFRYRPRLKFLKYSTNGNIEEFARMNKSGILENTRTSYIWGYNKALPIAEVVNAPSNKIAFANFETDDLGGWSYSTINYIDTDAKTGLRCNTGTFYKGVPEDNYIVSLWANGTGSISVNGNARTLSPSWNYYEWVISNATNIVISNNGSKLDDIRLYPKNALMTTYTYDPLRGIHEITDPNNIITQYDYDPHGRLKFISDLDASILKMYDYNYITK